MEAFRSSGPDRFPRPAPPFVRGNRTPSIPRHGATAGAVKPNVTSGRALT